MYRGKSFEINDYEILTTILSALKWREKNGEIKLYTDKIGKEYYEKIKLDDLWDLGIDSIYLDSIKENINPSIFWAAGKIFAVQKEETPFFLLDTDFIVWENIKHLIDNSDLIGIHTEQLYPDIYLSKEYLKFPKGYKIDSDLNWNVDAINCAFLFFNNNALKEYYCSESIKFMNNNLDEPLELVSQMVFAEQRLLGMIVDKMQLKIKTFLTDPFDSNNSFFTHIWGFKREMQFDVSAKNMFCIKCIKRILRDYPFMESRLFEIPTIKPFKEKI